MLVLFQIVKAAGKGKLATLLKSSLEQKEIIGDVVETAGDIACKIPGISIACDVADVAGDVIDVVGKQPVGNTPIGVEKSMNSCQISLFVN